MTTLLIDCYASVYRAYYTTGKLSSGGNPTGIPYGFFWNILTASERFKTNKLVFCWDSKESKRREIFPDYKLARRTDLTDEEAKERREIHQQIDTLRIDTMPSVGFGNNHYATGYEADDLIAKMVIDHPDSKFVGVSSDNDLFQLLRFKNFLMFSPTANKLWTASSFMHEHGIPARDWVLVKSIAGCPGDGVPGVKGVAVPTAIKYVKGELSQGKKMNDIVKSFDLFKYNYKLVSLPFRGTPSISLKKDTYTLDSLLTFFDDCDFRSFLTADMKKRWTAFVKGDWK